MNPAERLGSLDSNRAEKMRVLPWYLPWHRVAEVTYSLLPNVNDAGSPPLPPCARVVPFSSVTPTWSTREPLRSDNV